MCMHSNEYENRLVCKQNCASLSALLTSQCAAHDCVHIMWITIFTINLQHLLILAPQIILIAYWWHSSWTMPFMLIVQKVWYSHLWTLGSITDNVCRNCQHSHCQKVLDDVTQLMQCVCWKWHSWFSLQGTEFAKLLLSLSQGTLDCLMRDRRKQVYDVASVWL